MQFKLAAILSSCIAASCGPALTVPLRSPIDGSRLGAGSIVRIDSSTYTHLDVPVQLVSIEELKAAGFTKYNHGPTAPRVRLELSIDNKNAVKAAIKASLAEVDTAITAEFLSNMEISGKDLLGYWDNVFLFNGGEALRALSVTHSASVVEDIYAQSNDSPYYVQECLIVDGGEIGINSSKQLSTTLLATLKSQGFNFATESGSGYENKFSLSPSFPLILSIRLHELPRRSRIRDLLQSLPPAQPSILRAGVHVTWISTSQESTVRPTEFAAPFQRKATSTWGNDDGRTISGRVPAPTGSTLKDFTFDFFKILGKRDVTGTVVRDGNAVVYSFRLKHGPWNDRWRHQGGVNINMNCVGQESRLEKSIQESSYDLEIATSERIQLSYPQTLPPNPDHVSASIQITPLDGGPIRVETFEFSRPTSLEGTTKGSLQAWKLPDSLSLSIAWKPAS